MPHQIVAIAGSLRAGSLNRMLAHAASELSPPAMTLAVFDELDRIPLFNEDLETSEPEGPGSVAKLRLQTSHAAGLLFATPEYNQSISGVMKNVVDWLSRPEGDSVLDGKPAAVIGATTGPWGTRYAQKELRHVLTAAGAIVMPQPMLFVPNAERVSRTRARWLCQSTPVSRFRNA